MPLRIGLVPVGVVLPYLINDNNQGGIIHYCPFIRNTSVRHFTETYMHTPLFFVFFSRLGVGSRYGFIPPENTAEHY